MMNQAGPTVNQRRPSVTAHNVSNYEYSAALVNRTQPCYDSRVTQVSQMARSTRAVPAREANDVSQQDNRDLS